MDFFENIDALLWRLAAILALVLVATLVVRLLLRDRGRSDRQQKLRVQQTLKGSGLAADKAPNGFTFGLLGGKKVYLPCDGEGHIAIFGGSGQGKTSALLIPSLRVWQGPFFCIDISGDISKNVPGEKKVLLAPDDPEHSVIYNVFDEIDRARSGRTAGAAGAAHFLYSALAAEGNQCRALLHGDGPEDPAGISGGVLRQGP